MTFNMLARTHTTAHSLAHTHTHARKHTRFYTHSDVYTLCVAQPEPMADRLYSETKYFLESHVKEMLATKVLAENDAANANNTSSRPDLLQRYYTTWMEYSQGIKYLHQLYM